MRVTQNMINYNMIKNVNASLERMSKSYDQLATSKKFQKPSDDPMGFIGSIKANDSLVEVDRYRDNCNTVISWMNASDQALDQFTSVLNQLEIIGVGASNGTLSQTSCDAYANQVAELQDYLLQIANTKYDDRYLFSGQNVDVPAYGEDASGTIVYQGGAALNIQIGNDSTMQYSYPGNEIFEYDSDGDGITDKTVFQFLDELEQSIRNMDFDSVSESLNDIQTMLDNALNIQASYGSKVKRLELNVERLDELENQFKTIRSDAEDADLAAVTIEYNTQQLIYEAALAAGGKVMKLSLMNYI